MCTVSVQELSPRKTCYAMGQGWNGSSGTKATKTEDWRGGFTDTSGLECKEHAMHFKVKKSKRHVQQQIWTLQYFLGNWKRKKKNHIQCIDWPPFPFMKTVHKVLGCSSNGLQPPARTGQSQRCACSLTHPPSLVTSWSDPVVFDCMFLMEKLKADLNVLGVLFQNK